MKDQLSDRVRRICWAFARQDNRWGEVVALAADVALVEQQHGQLLAALRGMVGSGGPDGGEHYECRGVACEIARDLLRRIGAP